MIEKLKRKFILITMASVLIVLTVVVLLLNGYNFYRIDQRADALLAVLTENNGRFPEVTVRVDFRPAQELRPEFQLALTEETPFETRYFWVRTDAQGAVSRANTNNIAAVSKNEAIQYSQTALAGGKTTGYQGLYKYRVAGQADNWWSLWTVPPSSTAGSLSCSAHWQWRPFAFWLCWCWSPCFPAEPWRP